jgi:ATP-dependent Zn protease
LILGLTLGALAPATLAASAKSESEAEFQQQLAAKQVHSVVINKHERSMRVTLKDGTVVTTRYPKKQSEQTKQRIEAKGVRVTVLTPAEAKKEAGPTKKKSHHKLRYIVGAVVIVVILLVVAVLVINRRRRRD